METKLYFYRNLFIYTDNEFFLLTINHKCQIIKNI